MEFEQQTISIEEPDLKADEGTLSRVDLLQIYFEQAKADYNLLNFSKALISLKKVTHAGVLSGDLMLYLESLILMSRIYLEQGQKEELLKTAIRIRCLQDEANLSPKTLAKIHYSLGILNFSEADGKERALQQFQKSIDVALEIQDRECLAYAVYGVANVHYGLKDYAKSLIELEKLDQILMFHSVPDIKVSSLLLKSFIKRNQEEPVEALKLARQACESLRENPNIYLFLQALYALGSTYLKLKDFASAQIYLELAKASCPPDQLPRMYDVLIKSLNQCRTEGFSNAAIEIVFDRASGTLKRKGVGTVSLQGQFILRELLALLFENPGKAFSKEELVRKIWNENYSPLVHDNKIYVTLKRLRQTLEPLFKDNNPILRTKEGYAFNNLLFSRV